MDMKVGDRVNRKENRDVTSGTIIEVICHTSTCTIYHITYDEGGDGWWTNHTLELIESPT